MEAVVIIISIIIVTIASLIVKIINKIFFRYQMLLCLFYSSMILFFLCISIMYYRQLNQISSAIIPFTARTGNSVEFTFTPNYTGYYSMSLAFFNESRKRYYEQCEFWESGDKTKCSNNLIYRTIKWSANDEHFSGKNVYFGTVPIEKWIHNPFHYGYGNYAVKGTSLSFYQFIGTRNMPLHVGVQIDATVEEILSAKAAIIVGATEQEEAISRRQLASLLTLISLPILIAIARILWRRFRRNNK